MSPITPSVRWMRSPKRGHGLSGSDVMGLRVRGHVASAYLRAAGDTGNMVALGGKATSSWDQRYRCTAGGDAQITQKDSSA